MSVQGFALAVASLNFTGSLLSAIGSGCIILCYLSLPLRRHFRHVLILNLAVADFINSVNNTASGSQILIHRKDLSPGPGCVLNGLLGQITVQATDCAILAIALVTVYSITRTSHARLISGEWEWPTILLATCLIWIMPLTTGFLALAKKWYVPVSGNWCWLVKSPVYLRYAMTHGWRYLFMVLEIGLYTYLHFYLRRHFRRLAKPIVSNLSSSDGISSQRIPLTPITLKGHPIESRSDSSLPDEAGFPEKTSAVQSDNSYSAPALPTSARPQKHVMAHQREDKVSTTNPRERAIQRVLLLNAYPLLYIILWIPGLANRIVEATGNKSRVTQIMQASTQFVGLANALTYGWNERIAKQFMDKYIRRR
ncbi:hypothetical protein HGRIS_006479 [Hohenbuehelia grisea]|uniref:Glucose receptor Git3-like N-terminal domain-containing protein n=1 Tax=Hohenbuehelia grisea TaxID=104357 RepID=A0ABR3K2T1_9AGAR